MRTTAFAAPIEDQPMLRSDNTVAINMIEIEQQARALRAQATREMFAFVADWFRGLFASKSRTRTA